MTKKTNKNVIANEIIHKIQVENGNGEKVNISIDMGNMIQTNEIVEMFDCFSGMSDLVEIKTDGTLESLMDLSRKLAKLQKQINVHMTEAFGNEILEKVFSGGGSIPQYLYFFDYLSDEIEKAGIKIEEFTKTARKKDVIDNLEGHKRKNVL